MTIALPLLPGDHDGAEGRELRIGLQCEGVVRGGESWPEAMFFALAGDEIVGCAGLEFDEEHPGRVEHALTAVAPPWRRKGIASMLKRMTLAFAAANGVREVYTWTQLGNAAMRALNERLGYELRGEAIPVRGPLPLHQRPRAAN